MKNRAGAGYVVAVASVCAVTIVIAVVDPGTHISNISMLYLVAVIAVAVFYGQGPAILISIGSFLAFDVFFVEPRFTLTVSDPSEWVALGLFLVTAVITGQLAATQRLRAIEAEQRERETAVLYDMARLMSAVDNRSGFEAVAARLIQELNLAAVGIELTAIGTREPISIELGEPDAREALRVARVMPSRLLMEGASPTATTRGGAGRWIRAVPSKGALIARGSGLRPEVVPIRAGDMRIGNLTVVRREGSETSHFNETRLLTSTAAQIGAAAELERLRGEATEAEALRRTDELKTALLNAVSHDLRTPLASIVASAGSLQQTDVAWTDADRLEFAEGIENEAQRLNRLVGNLLDLSRIESGSLRPDKGWYDIEALIEEVVGRLKPVLAGHPVKLSIPPGLPPMELDYIEIDEVLSNLLENAVKYTPAGTEIEVAARPVEGSVEISVADRGPGLSAEALARIFEPFYRAPNTTAKGTGLGLSVAKGLVEAHGGTMWASNRKEGGAVFRFTLPIAKTAEAQE